jgi:hypothetical protein
LRKAKAINIQENDNLIAILGFNNLDTVTCCIGIAANHQLLSLSGFNNVVQINGDLFISGNQAMTISNSFNKLKTIGNDLYFSCPICTNISFFEGLTSIEGYAIIESNQALKKLDGIDSLSFIGKGLYLKDNPKLQDLDALNKISEVGRFIYLLDNAILNDISGLGNIDQIGGDLHIIGNDSLKTLVGLGNIAPASIEDIRIQDNPMLTMCEVQSICDYLASPNGSVSIYNNAPGCNTPTEVDSACAEIGIAEFTPELEIILYPNPAQKEIYIFGGNGSSISEVHIFNYLGQKVLHEKELESYIDVSMLEAGLYIVEVVSDKGIVRKKMMLVE